MTHYDLINRKDGRRVYEGRLTELEAMAAAPLWACGCDSAEIGRFLGVPEHAVMERIEIIKDIARQERAAS